jgi:hypothetical protein
MQQEAITLYTHRPLQGSVRKPRPYRAIPVRQPSAQRIFIAMSKGGRGLHDVTLALDM